MLKGATYKRTKPNRIRRELNPSSADAIGHPHEKRDEIEPVIVDPIFVAGIDHPGIVVEQPSVKQLLVGRYRSALTEKFILVHDTDFF